MYVLFCSYFNNKLNVSFLNGKLLSAEVLGSSSNLYHSLGNFSRQYIFDDTFVIFFPDNRI